MQHPRYPFRYIRGNMILIKDRHWTVRISSFAFAHGKYDPYKGSTRFVAIHSNISYDFGNYDTYKGLTLTNCKISSVPTYQGNYDTYKGSTPGLNVQCPSHPLREI